MSKQKVLLLEINEITWDLIDPLLEQGKLPNFKYLKTAGAWASPMSVDLPPQLDPWITWTTVYTGRPQSAHSVYFLEQPPETIKAQRLWEYCHEKGLRVGVYSSLCSWPPKPVDGFFVPDTFAPDTQTYPPSLSPIQQLNLTYTRSIRLPKDEDGVLAKFQLGLKLLKLGLSVNTAFRIIKQLLSEQFAPELRWKRVALQPLVNFDFFSQLYRRHQPEFATFHTNHVAHYQHTYWKAMQPDIFPQKTSREERLFYGDAIEYGYKTADEILGRVLSLIDRNTTLIVASSMGQKPYISNLIKGRRIKQLRSLQQLLEILGVADQATALATMSDQFNIYSDNKSVAEFITFALATAYVDTPDHPMFSVENFHDSITSTLKTYDEITEDSRCYFPQISESTSFRYEDLVHNTGQMKTGCHDPKGMMILYGRDVKPGVKIEQCNNLDIAPTVLRLLGLSIPKVMEGRVLHEALSANADYQQVAKLKMAS